jgi:hypothetical protein
MRVTRLGACAAIVLTASCSSESVTPESVPALNASAAVEAGPVSYQLARINDSLAALGLNIAVQKAEYILAPTAPVPASGQIVFANDRAKRLTSRWVPGDARRLADGDRITYMNFAPLMAANGAGNAEGAIDASFATWDASKCTTLDIVERAWNGGNPSAILSIAGIPAVSVFSADIVTMGFLPGFIFDAVLGPGASASVLGVTFTFVFLESAGGPESDIDGDGRTDTALKEIWYNNAFDWTLSGLGDDIDVESVALHENGHAFELGHYGKIFGTLGNLRLHVSPRAVMNAAILGTLRSPLGTDNAGFCGNFEDWG